MCCPSCGCKVTYPYDDGLDCITYDDNFEICAACGHVFHGLDAEDDPDDYLELPCS